MGYWFKDYPHIWKTHKHYRVKFGCTNCGKKFHQLVLKGRIIFGGNTKCPRCGVSKPVNLHTLSGRNLYELSR